MRICLLTHTFPPHSTSGGGVYMYELAKGLINQGHQVTIITKKIKEQKQLPFFGNLSVKYLFTNTSSFILFPFFSRLLFSRKVKHPVDVLHGNHIYHWTFCLIKPRNVKKIITTTHNSYIQRFIYYKLTRKIIYPVFILLEQIVLSISDKIITASEFSARFVRRYLLSSEKIVIIPTGVHTSTFKKHEYTNAVKNTPIPFVKENKYVLFVGRLDDNKRPEILIRSMSLIKTTNVVAVLIGKGKNKGRLKSEVDQLQLRDKVFFIESVSRDTLISIYSLVNIFVLLSKSEGLPMTLLEAAACELPIIATKNATAESKIVSKGINGFLVDPDPQDVARRIDEVLRHDQEMGKKSREMVKKYFSISEMIAKTMKVYVE